MATVMMMMTTDRGDSGRQGVQAGQGWNAGRQESHRSGLRSVPGNGRVEDSLTSVPGSQDTRGEGGAPEPGPRGSPEMLPPLFWGSSLLLLLPSGLPSCHGQDSMSHSWGDDRRRESSRRSVSREIPIPAEDPLPSAGNAPNSTAAPSLLRPQQQRALLGRICARGMGNFVSCPGKLRGRIRRRRTALSGDAAAARHSTLGGDALVPGDGAIPPGFPASIEVGESGNPDVGSGSSDAGSGALPGTIHPSDPRFLSRCSDLWRAGKGLLEEVSSGGRSEEAKRKNAVDASEHHP